MNNDATKYPNISISSIIKSQIRSSNGIAFISTVIVGLLAHLYIYTNLYLGHDAALLHNYVPSLDIITGRFASIVVRYLNGALQTPWLIGYISLIFLGVASALICKILKITKPVYIVLISATIVTWPTITSMHCFVFATSVFSFSILMACMAAYVTDRYKFGFIAGIPLIVVSMGCYQTLWGLSAALLLICMIRNICINHDEGVRAVLVKLLRYAATLILGFIAYFGLWKLTMNISGLAAIEYKGMDDLGYSSASEFLNVLYTTYRTVYWFFLRPDRFSYYPSWLMVVCCISVVIAICLIFVLIVKRKIYKSPVKLFLLAVCFLLFPIAINCTELFSKSLSVNVLGFFAFALPFFLLPMVLSQLDLRKVSYKKYIAVMCISVIPLICSSLNGLYGANASYLKLDANYHIAISQVSQYMSRISAVEGYETGTPIALIGFANPFKPSGFEWCRDITGVFDSALTYSNINVAIFSMINPGTNVVWDATPYANLPSVQALKSYPSNDCVVWVDDTLVFRLSDVSPQKK
jgi:hypothetical protein